MNAVAATVAAKATQFTFTAFAYSGIIPGSKFSFEVSGSANLLSRSTDLMPDPSDDIDEDESPTSVVDPGEADFLYGETPQQGVVVVDEGDDDEDDEEEHADNPARAHDSSYTAVADMSDMMLTGIRVVKQSLFRDIAGPRDALRVSRTRVCKEINGRMDMLAAAVRLTNHLIDSHDVNIHNGHEDMEAYELASDIVTKPRSLGWARRPQWGKQYGAKYIRAYANEIRELFNRGAAKISEKLGPAQMLEELKRRHPGKYTVPSESEIRNQITVLFTRQKQGDGEGGEDGDSISKQRGRKSNIPDALQEYLQELVSATDRVAPAAALAKVKQKFGELIKGKDGKQLTDNQIKTKFNNLKALTNENHPANFCL